MFINSIITGTGSYVPDKRVPNDHFLSNTFFNSEGQEINKPKKDIITKLKQISGVSERRYIGDDQDTSDLAVKASEAAIRDSGLDRNDLDAVILAHNFGNIPPGEHQGYLIPNLAALVKGKLGIRKPRCFAYDLLFGCPGWTEAVIAAHQYLQTGRAKHVLVVGVEVISRLLDPHDMDSMLFGDGAGAVVISSVEEEVKRGILGHNTYSHCGEELDYLRMDRSYCGKEDSGMLTPKMAGQKVFKYAITEIPTLILECLKDNGLTLEEVDKFLFHQANEKMIVRIAHILLGKSADSQTLERLVPITVHMTGNSSVATIPTMLDDILKGRLAKHELQEGDLTVMASVGAGMHCNCVLYRF